MNNFDILNNHVDKMKIVDKQIRIACPYCSYTTSMPVYIDYKICKNCGHRINNTTKAYFIYKLKKKLKEGGNNE